MCVTLNEQQQETTISTKKEQKEDIAQKKLWEIGFFNKLDMSDIDSRFESEKQILRRFLDFERNMHSVATDFKSNEKYVTQALIQKQQEAGIQRENQGNLRGKVNPNARYANYNEKSDNKLNDKRKKRAASARKKGLDASYNETAYMLNCMEEDDKDLIKYGGDDENLSLGYVYANLNISKEWKNDDGEPCKRFRNKKGYLSKSSREQRESDYLIGSDTRNETPALNAIKKELFKKKDLSHFTPEYISKNFEAAWDELKLLQGAELLFGQEGAYRTKLATYEQQMADTVIEIAHYAEKMFNKSLEIMGITKGKKGYKIGKVTPEDLAVKNTEMENLKRAFNEAGLDTEKILEDEILRIAKTKTEELIEDKNNVAIIKKEAMIKKEKGEKLSRREEAALNDKENIFDYIIPSVVEHAAGTIEDIKELINKNPQIYETNKSTIDMLLKDLRISFEMFEKVSIKFQGIETIEVDSSETELLRKRNQMFLDHEKNYNVIQKKTDAILHMIKSIFKPEKLKNIDFKNACILNHYYPDLVKSDYLDKLKDERKKKIIDLYGKDTKIPEELKNLPNEKLKEKINRINALMDKINFKTLLGNNNRTGEYLGQIMIVKTEVLSYGSEKLAMLYDQIMREDAVSAGLFENEKEKELFGIKMKILENAGLVYRMNSINSFLDANPQLTEEDIFDLLNEEEKGAVMEAFNRLTPDMITEYKKKYEVEDDNEFRRMYIYSKTFYYFRTILDDNGKITKKFKEKLA